MSRKLVNMAVRPIAKRLQSDHMCILGIANTMRLARTVNWLRYRKQVNYRRLQYARHFEELIRENGEPNNPVLEVKDGYVLDTTRTLPHLHQLLDDAHEIIEERGGVQRKTAGAYRAAFQNIIQPDDFDRYPSILDFALSSEVLSVVCNYLKTIPVMPTSIPGGVRFAESSVQFDDTPNTLKDSQLFHIDYFCKPDVYVIVLLRDVTSEHGPFSFVPASISRETSRALNYWRRGRPYRLRDEEVYSVLDRDKVIPLTYSRGTVLFLDPSACLHFGSRNAIKPRYQLMYAYMTPCRTDFNEFITNKYSYRSRSDDSRLARMVLEKRCTN